ncbi:MAG: NADP-dependent malic enzyme [bacterium]|nr:NADP-dependent malic enzyme [bacterium]
MEKVYRDALAFHKKYGGKLAMQSKMPLSGRSDLSLAYTPGVAQVSREIFRDRKSAYAYTMKRNSIAIVTDGSAILGLGNLGAQAALPVMEGKAILFKKFSGIDAFPICLDTQDTEEIIRTVRYIAPGFGGINLEDISAPRCFEIEARLKKELDIPVMHDDQHGTAVVVLASLINALKLKGLSKKSTKVVINGAGAAGGAIAKLLYKYGITGLLVCDRRGLIFKGRRGLDGYKAELARLTRPAYANLVRGKIHDIPLAECLEGADVFIGVSTGNVVTAKMVQGMNVKPVIFALANPIPEIFPHHAKAAGAFIVASGRSDFPNQINNALVFPGIFRGALDNRVKQITDAMLIRAAQNLASCVSNPSPRKIIPSIFSKDVVRAVSRAITK